MKCKKIIALGFISLILFGNSAFAMNQNISTTSSQTVKITQKLPADAVNPLVSGKINTFKVGQKFSVVLEENATTGYSWTYTKNDKVIKLVNEISRCFCDKKLLGAPTTKVWIFKATKKGNYEIKFSYARPWEKKTPPVKTAVYTVKIK